MDVTFRAAYFETLKRAPLADQTLEPTSVAGFNQFYDDPEATIAQVRGLGMDVGAASYGIYGGLEVSSRDLNYTGIDRDLFQLFTTDVQETLAVAYLNWLPSKRWAIGLEYHYEDFDRNPDGFGFERIVDMKTDKVAASIRYFSPNGVSVSLEPTWVSQDGVFVSNFCDPEFGCPTYDGTNSFWVLDASISYQLPKRKGSLSLVVRNALDESFQFQDTDPFNPRLAPERTILVRGTLNF